MRSAGPMSRRCACSIHRTVINIKVHACVILYSHGPNNQALRLLIARKQSKTTASYAVSSHEGVELERLV